LKDHRIISEKAILKTGTIPLPFSTFSTIKELSESKNFTMVEIQKNFFDKTKVYLCFFDTRVQIYASADLLKSVFLILAQNILSLLQNNLRKQM
jgi:hypothetical protein